MAAGAVRRVGEHGGRRRRRKAPPGPRALFVLIPVRIAGGGAGQVPPVWRVVSAWVYFLPCGSKRTKRRRLSPASGRAKSGPWALIRPHQPNAARLSMASCNLSVQASQMPHCRPVCETGFRPWAPNESRPACYPAYGLWVTGGSANDGLNAWYAAHDGCEGAHARLFSIRPDSPR
jgi:hypothetical protein